jgi:hypothetical protein
VSIPDPCCDPSAAELTSRTLGPVQTLYESLNRFISLGGNDHIDRQHFCPGRERVTCLRQYHRGCNMKRVRVDERPGITLFTFYNWGPRFVTRRSKSIKIGSSMISRTRGLRSMSMTFLSSSAVHLNPFCITYKYRLVHTSTYQYIPVCTHTYWFILVHTGTYEYISVHSSSYLC